MKQDFAVTVARVEGAWQVRPFEDDFTNVRTSVNAVRNLRSEGAAFALLCVDNDYFVIVRPTPTRVQFLLSDATAAAEDDFAADILDELDVDIPDADEEPYAEGDFDILADLGVSEQVMQVITDEIDWWASEQLLRIAEELGFEDELADL
ncbi:tRNA adenosine deaminase-associated protein [Corynebacterium sp. 153RC1]|uniref:tRNA adenosine deaminase-associated protein n=1 Tax=Corynebacterium TaxID=1716 RepID=UPI00211CD549|nr:MULTISPECIES: tRNA adenosine deaminase-associated protein [unclassified Corynebacterium]MCQ9370811.1 tRNA adenosine deaminase-associated protein [Corynebacterium sp. 35RC1]MCQ9344197.1 tRNA adenosine deaminase-associated protein [Corynebacterium sp. 76QC2CO]MCQ9353453.1 tRNA adenosine deaminase-associated protein [Corynebacterium sp. 209RC1]MCQ9355111.1 tRNA adenosine deaminase-associated protein [Corynebacterium sp. 1222RC1]MCQ9357473.1 tRNA adenosine deaminase-associated protein [Coryneba